MPKPYILGGEGSRRGEDKLMISRRDVTSRMGRSRSLHQQSGRGVWGRGTARSGIESIPTPLQSDSTLHTQTHG